MNRNYNTKRTNSWTKFGNIKNLTQSDFEKACSESSSMAEACSKLGIHFGTFKKHAIKYNCYNTNQSGKGTNKDIPPTRWDMEKWNNNESLNVTRFTIKKWIIKLKLFPLKCNRCNLEEWFGNPISLELHHINGNGHDHRKSNLELICPNCHSQTINYRGKNKT